MISQENLSGRVVEGGRGGTLISFRNIVCVGSPRFIVGRARFKKYQCLHKKYGSVYIVPSLKHPIDQSTNRLSSHLNLKLSLKYHQETMHTEIRDIYSVF